MNKELHVVVESELETADQFLDALDPRRPELSDSERVFRGQADARWRLIPSALRPGAWLSLVGAWMVTLRVNDLRYQLANEFHSVEAFAREADRQGLPVPGYDTFRMFSGGDLQPKMDALLREGFDGGLGFPPQEWESMFAMAQHYGIPTRLLDWSESAYVAAYFAASEAAKKLHENPRLHRRHLRVWALKPVHMGNPDGSKRWGEIHTVHAPWATNPNLRAQKGLFTVHRHPYRRGRGAGISLEEYVHLPEDADTRVIPIPRPVPLEKLIPRLFESASDLTRNWYLATPVLRSYTLPWKEAGALLIGLRAFGISAASLFPGYEGVAQSIREARFGSPFRDYRPSGGGFSI